MLRLRDPEKKIRRLPGDYVKGLEPKLPPPAVEPIVRADGDYSTEPLESRTAWEQQAADLVTVYGGQLSAWSNHRRGGQMATFQIQELPGATFLLFTATRDWVCLLKHQQSDRGNGLASLRAYLTNQCGVIATEFAEKFAQSTV